MKKLSLFLIIGSLLVAGASFGQDTPDRPVRKPGEGPGNPPVPRAVENNEQFKQWSVAFQEDRDEFRSKLEAMRKALATASEAEKETIRQQIREQLKTHRESQTEFRKNVRRLMLGLREERVGPGSGG